MNFAPYQDDSPEATRALSPPPPAQSSPRKARQPAAAAAASAGDPWGYEASTQASPQQQQQQQQPGRPFSPSAYESRIGELPAAQQRRAFGNGLGADERNMDVFSTSLPMRLDYEACLAYLLLPPAGAAVLLLFEHKSDYVRYHAWQSGLVFTFLFVLHIILSFTKVFSFILLVFDLSLIGLLVFHAYKDAETLDRYELPFFGPLANRFVDDE